MKPGGICGVFGPTGLYLFEGLLYQTDPPVFWQGSAAKIQSADACFAFSAKVEMCYNVGRKGGNGMDWILQNKDVPLLEFSTREDKFGDVKAREHAWLSPLRPIGYTSLLGFLEGRRAPKHRKHIEQLLEQYGCRTLEGFLQVSHALSLNDTFWVKPAGSPLRWQDVSLYQNDFDEIIAGV